MEGEYLHKNRLHMYGYNQYNHALPLPLKIRNWHGDVGFKQSAARRDGKVPQAL